MSGEPRPPRFNHVAMSLAPQLLEPEGRAELCAFYGDVFGWEELPTETVDGARLVFSVHDIGQFVFLVGDDQPMMSPRMDHFGLSVATEAELDHVLERAKSFQTRDDRVDIIDKAFDDHGVLSITSIYVGFLLPMMVEIQYWQFAETPAAT